MVKSFKHEKLVMKPDPKLIDSMAIRYRHDFGFLDEQTQNSIRTTMSQLWEEVVGLGFYRYKSLYTEEEVKKLMFEAYSNGAKGNAYYSNAIIQSLKQPKE